MPVHQNTMRYYRQPSRFTSAIVRLAWVIALVTLLVSPRTLMAQAAPAEQAPAASEQTDAEPAADEEFFGEAHRRRIYEQSQLSTTRAVLYNLALPGLGNVYAEQYFYAGIAFTLMVFTLVFEGYGLVTEQPQFLWMGGATALVAYSGSIATSIFGVRDYNRELREGLKLDDSVAQGPWGLPKARTIDFAFRF